MVRMSHLLDQFEVAQTLELARQRCRGQVHMRGQIGATQTAHIGLATLQGTQQGLLGSVEEVESLDPVLANRLGLAEFDQIAQSRTRIVQTGQERQVALVAAQQYLAQVDQAVDGDSS